MSLYIYNGKCYTKSEKNALIKKREANKKEFQPLRTKKDLKTCKDKLTVKSQYHPIKQYASCYSSNKVVQQVNNKISEYNGNSKNIPLYLDARGGRDFLTVFEEDGDYEIETVQEDISYIDENPGEFRWICRMSYRHETGNGGHIFVVIIDIKPQKQKFFPREATRLTIIDTGPFTGDVKKFVRKLGEALDIYVNIPQDIKVDIPLNEIADEFGIDYNDELVYLQVSEKVLSKAGYCAAWALYFIYQVALGKNIKNIYKYMILDKSNEAMAARIMRWWKVKSS